MISTAGLTDIRRRINWYTPQD